MIDLAYLMAGKATFTIANPKKDRYTYKVSLSKELNRHFVYMLTGSNNETDYTYVGMISYENLLLTRASKFKESTLPVKVFKYALDIAKGNKALLPGYFLEHNGHCGRCGRKLTTPESIKLGLGPVCRGK